GLNETQMAERDLPQNRATKIIATSARLRPDAEPNRLQSEPRARRLALEEEASRSYRDEGRIFLPSASTIDRLIPLAKKSSRRRLRTRHKRCDTAKGLCSGLP